MLLSFVLFPATFCPLTVNFLDLVLCSLLISNCLVNIITIVFFLLLLLLLFQSVELR
jgi:hypothetical protein